jgi:hypothetical protein
VVLEAELVLVLVAGVSVLGAQLTGVAELARAGQGFAVGTLRWWSSRLGREGARPAAAISDIRLAKVVRSPEPVGGVAPGARGAVIIELHDARVRVVVETGVDRATLSTVLELVGKGDGR